MSTSGLLRSMMDVVGMEMKQWSVSEGDWQIYDAIVQHSDLIGSTIDALIAGADAGAIHEYIKSVLVAASDAEMRREFPGQ